MSEPVPYEKEIRTLIEKIRKEGNSDEHLEIDQLTEPRQ
jgi:hypothetical protein